MADDENKKDDIFDTVLSADSASRMQRSIQLNERGDCPGRRAGLEKLANTFNTADIRSGSGGRETILPAGRCFAWKAKRFPEAMRNANLNGGRRFSGVIPN